MAMAMAMTVTATPNNWFGVQHTETCTRTWIHIVCNIIYTRFGHDIQSFSFASNDDYYYFVDLLMDGFSENYTVHVAMRTFSIYVIAITMTCLENWIRCYLGLPVGWTFKIDTIIAVQKYRISMHANAVWFSGFWRSRLFVCNARCYMHTHLWVWHSIILIWINRNKFRFEWYLVYRLHNSNECHSKPIIVYLSIGESHLLKRLRNDLSDGKKRQICSCFWHRCQIKWNFDIEYFAIKSFYF